MAAAKPAEISPAPAPAAPAPRHIVAYPKVNILMGDGTVQVLDKGAPVPEGADPAALRLQVTIGHVAAVNAPTAQ
jgi:hypothetical protein